MMPTVQTAANAFPDPAGDAADIVLLSASGDSPQRFDLDLASETPCAVELNAVAGGGDPFLVRVTADETPIHAATVGEEFFDGVPAERFATLTGRPLSGVTGVSEAEATAAIADALGDIRELFADGRLHVVDKETRDLIDNTAEVTYLPAGEGTWVVTFDDADLDYSALTYRRQQAKISAEAWANTSRPPTLPATIRRVFKGAEATSRWQVARQIWMRMAAVADDAPPVHVEITASELRERGTVPGIGVDVDALDDVAREEKTFQGARRALDVDKSNMSTLRAALSALGLEDDLEKKSFF